MAKMKAEDWVHIIKLQPQDFIYPEELEFSIVNALDKFSVMIGQKPEILSDWRPFDPNNPGSKHPEGIAIDTFWAGKTAEYIFQAAEKSNLFDGIGVYINPENVPSFHFDTRGERARWGGIISRPADPETGQILKKIEYVAASIVLEMFKKKRNYSYNSDFAVVRGRVNNTEREIAEIYNKVKKGKRSWLKLVEQKALGLGLKILVKIILKNKS